MKISKNLFRKLIFWTAFLYGSFTIAAIVNDVTQLNPISVNQIITPKSANEVRHIIKNHNGTVSIGGGRYSQGGQIATDNTLFLDMRKMNHILNLDKEKHQITVESGITWREIQEFIDKYDLSIKIMQSFSNFTVGGSLSVNAHGRYVNEGPIIRSVQSIKIILADGKMIKVSKDENPEIFFGAIGGYGGIGVIVEATLSLSDNTPVERISRRMKVSSYKDYFFQKIRYSNNAIFHNAVLYSPNFKELNAITWVKTNKPVTIEARLAPQTRLSASQEFLLGWVSDSTIGKYFRQHIYDRYKNSGSIIEWRNYEASYDVNSIEPISREKSTYILQEYFIPIGRFNSFIKKMTAILQHYHVNVLNISIRHALPDPGSYLAWARSEVFSFVIYYKQGVTERDKQIIQKWTSKLIAASLDEGGTYYLPYQIIASESQFLKAYPRAKDFFHLKNTVDPQYKFRNKLFDRYYKNMPG